MAGAGCGLFEPHPPLSKIFKSVANEEVHWQGLLEDFEKCPADGLRGKGMARKATYVEQDRNLQQLLEEKHLKTHMQYLRAISYCLHF